MCVCAPCSHRDFFLNCFEQGEAQSSVGFGTELEESCAIPRFNALNAAMAAYYLKILQAAIESFDRALQKP